MSIFFNFYLAPDCIVCQEVWPVCRAIVSDQKLPFNLTKVGKNYPCPSCSSDNPKALTVDSEGVPSVPVKIALYTIGCIKVSEISIPAFPCMAYIADGKEVIVTGENIIKELVALT